MVLIFDQINLSLNVVCIKKHLVYRVMNTLMHLITDILVQQFKLGMSFMKLAFNMESWEACGGGTELSGEEALAVGNKYIDKALEIFEEVSP